jgi:tungstate transport system ATP-binding protein
MLDNAPQVSGLPPDQGLVPGPVLVAFDSVSVWAGPTALLDDATLELTAGRPTMLLGPNGSGKTTLLKLAMGLIEPTSGHVIASDVRRAFVFQKPIMLRRSVAANVAFALTAAGRAASASDIAQLLEQVGLGDFGQRPARKLSGGEQQRLAFARALARQPDILFLDEPTASLDPAATKRVEEIIADIACQGVKIVMATHDLGQARRLAGDIVFLVGGRLVEHAPAHAFFAQPATDAARRFLAGDLVI